MKKLLIGIVVVIALVALFFIFGRTKVIKEEPIVIEASTLPLIIVDSGTAHIKKNTMDRVVESGERIEAPFTLETATGSLAHIQFGDNSEIRIRENSTLVVDGGTYTKETGELKVHVKLSIGRIWSDIVALVTPESSWEVETSNVVATVRGTAFDVEARADGSTEIIGSVHSVLLTLIDPKTGARNENKKAMLGEDEFVIINTNDATDTSVPFPKIEKKSATQEDDTWIKANESRREENGGAQRPETNDVVPKNTIPEPQKEVTAPVVASTVPSLPSNPIQKSSSVSVPKPLSINITASTPLNGITEGIPVTLTATLVLSDGTKREITNEVVWSLIGKVGSIRGNIFMPLLDPSVSEYGHAYGNITADWKNATTGEVLNTSTDPFEVKLKPYQGILQG